MTKSKVDLTSLPSPIHLTLLFKYDKSTTLLSVLPSQSIQDVKTALLAVLQSRNVLKFPGTSTPLPMNADNLELGITRDRRDGRDTSKGWINAEDAQAVSSTIKNGTKKRGGAAKEIGLVETIGELDLKDGSYVAYRLKTSVDDMVEEGTEEAMQWNVILPSYDDYEEDPIGNAALDGDAEEDDEMDIPIPIPRNNVAGS